MDFGNLFISITGVLQGSLLADSHHAPPGRAAPEYLKLQPGKLPPEPPVYSQHTITRCLSRKEELGFFLFSGEYYESWSDVLSQEAELSASSSSIM